MAEQATGLRLGGRSSRMLLTMSSCVANHGAGSEERQGAGEAANCRQVWSAADPLCWDFTGDNAGNGGEDLTADDAEYADRKALARERASFWAALVAAGCEPDASTAPLGPIGAEHG